MKWKYQRMSEAKALSLPEGGNGSLAQALDSTV